VVNSSNLISDLLEQIAFEARESVYVDEKSGVSARLTISGKENLYSAAERRALMNNEEKTFIRIGDFNAVIPSITGKIELVYEGEQEGPGIVAQSLIGKSIRKHFLTYFNDPDEIRKKKLVNPFHKIIDWFGVGNTLDILHNDSLKEYISKLKSVPGLEDLIKKSLSLKSDDQKYLFMEFALHGLAEYSMISKGNLSTGSQFKDLVSNLFTMPPTESDDDIIEDDNYGQ